jgi:hypothetical protein
LRSEFSVEHIVQNADAQPLSYSVWPTSTFIFISAPLAKEDVQLASLVPDKRYPNQDVLSVIEVKEGDDYSINVDKNFHTWIDVKVNSFFKTVVSKIFAVSWKNEETESLHM